MDSAFLFGPIPSGVVLVGLLAVVGALGVLLVAAVVRLRRRRASLSKLPSRVRKAKNGEDPPPVDGAPQNGPRQPSPQGRPSGR